MIRILRFFGFFVHWVAGRQNSRPELLAGARAEFIEIIERETHA